MANAVFLACESSIAEDIAKHLRQLIRALEMNVKELEATRKRNEEIEARLLASERA